MRSIDVMADSGACGNAIGKSTVAPVWAVASFIIVVALAAACGGSPGEDIAAGEPIAPQPVEPQEGLSLFAGALGGSGNIDGVGASAAFNRPNSVATDSAGNVYVADTDNHTIRKITPAGVVSTLAGTAGASGQADGTGADARFYSPSGVAAGADGTVYVADTFNGLVRKITPAGVVTTFATGNYPSGVATDSADNLYVNDCGSAWAGNPASLNKNRIRKLAPAGTEMWSAGGPCTEVAPPSYSDHRFRFPSSIGTDSADNLYVAWEDHHVGMSTPSGGSGFSVGLPGVPGSADGTGVTARFYYPSGVAAGPDGTAYVADTYNNKVRQITPTGVVTTLAGSGTSGAADGIGADARFRGPAAVATDHAGNIYVADQGSAIRKITPTGVVTTWAGTAAETGSADGAAAQARFYEPTGATTDSSGNVYLADKANNTIRKITTAGVVSTWAGVAGEGGSADGTGTQARFYSPYDVATDGSDNLYVADTSSHVIRRITPAGVVTTLAGLAGVSGSTDGVGAQARFNNPVGLALDRAGNIYVACGENAYTIRKVTPSGVVTTLAGTAGAAGHVDGAGAEARFSAIAGVATDGSGNIYVAENDSHTIRKITPEGVVSTFAGALWEPGATDGTRAQARFSYPNGIAIDQADNIYVADTGNNTIRKISPAGMVTTVVGQVGRVGFSPGALPGNLAGPRRLAIRGAQLYVTLRNGVAVVTPLP